MVKLLAGIVQGGIESWRGQKPSVRVGIVIITLSTVAGGLLGYWFHRWRGAALGVGAGLLTGLVCTRVFAPPTGPT